jgi:predicted O-methyltransferase YrrM
VLRSFRRIVPEPVRGLVRPLWRHSTTFYLRQAVRLCRTRLFHDDPSIYRVEKVRLRQDIDRYEELFLDSCEVFEATLSPFLSEFHWFIGRIYNGAFQAVDAELYYTMIRRHQPRLILEVGSGHSTHFALDGVRRNGWGCIACIDPDPRRSLPRDVNHIAAKVEDVDLGLFRDLGEGDILFIDSSHTTEEARYHVERLLPALARGVVVHHHDVYYPYDVYYHGDRAAFGEPDVLLDFYRHAPQDFRVLVSAPYVRYKDPALMRRLVRSHRWDPDRLPGSLWSVRL